MSLPIDEIVLGDAVSVLKSFPSNSIDCCVSSPVYFQQVDYQHPDQYGLESSIDEYLNRMAITFAEVYRTLKNGACCWIVIGDTSHNYSPIRAKNQRRKAGEYLHRRPKQEGYREKEVLGIPFKLAERLRSVGYLHRNTLVWDKGSCGTIANSDTAAITAEWVLQMGKWDRGGRPYLNCKPIRSSVLKFPPASDPVHPCPFPLAMAQFLINQSSELCSVVLDPFVGSGTTALAASASGRHFIGIELNPEFRDRALQRLAN